MSTPGEQAPTAGERPDRLGAAGSLGITVVWGGIAEVQADLHVVGHYRGVMPSGAERALDRAISPPESEGVICRHTRRRWLVGALGEIAYFPGPARPAAGTGVVRGAVLGMGRVGTFGHDNARSAFRTLLREVFELGGIRSVAMVLIGSGSDNLAIPIVAREMVAGFALGLRALPEHMIGLGPDGAALEILVVEEDRLRAEFAATAFAQLAKAEPAVSVTAGVVVGSGGRVGVAAAAVYGIRSLLGRLAAEPGAPAGGAADDGALAAVPEELRDQVAAGLAEIAPHPEDIVGVTVWSPAGGPLADSGSPLPVRVSARGSPNGILWSAVTGGSTIAEREVRLAPELLEQLVRRLTPPGEKDEQTLPHFLSHYVVPLDLQRQLDGGAPLIIEVDQTTSAVPWELLMPTGAATEAEDEALEPLAIQQCMARQMRTAYARTDREGSPGEPMRALVIGDPGSPERNLSVEDAWREAAEVGDILRKQGVEVDLFIGASGSTSVPNASPATRLDVLAALLTQTYDLVHYIGHGVFDPQRPELSGWVFDDGLLSARELTQLAQAPWLVMANACWSAARPAAPDSGGLSRGVDSNPGSVLADEFLRVGTGHFVGASWRLNAESAHTFATSFYPAVLGSADSAPATVGEAILAGRRALWQQSRDSPGGSPERRCAWAAYQHYGDPGDRLVRDWVDQPTPAPGPPPAAVDLGAASPEAGR